MNALTMEKNYLMTHEIGSITLPDGEVLDFITIHQIWLANSILPIIKYKGIELLYFQEGKGGQLFDKNCNPILSLSSLPVGNKTPIGVIKDSNVSGEGETSCFLICTSEEYINHIQVNNYEAQDTYTFPFAITNI